MTSDEISGEGCSWCDCEQVVYLMGQALCSECAEKFKKIHAEFGRIAVSEDERRAK